MQLQVKIQDKVLNDGKAGGMNADWKSILGRTPTENVLLAMTMLCILFLSIQEIYNETMFISIMKI